MTTWLFLLVPVVVVALLGSALLWAMTRPESESRDAHADDWLTERERGCY